MKIASKIIMLLLILISHFAYAQNQTDNKETRKMFSPQDSAKLYGYLSKVEEFSLLSVKRQQYLDSALAIVPYVAELWQQKAMPLFKQRKYELGMPYLDSAVKYDKLKEGVPYRAFMKCIFQKSYRAALMDFNLAQKLNGNSYIMDHSYEFYKGLCYLQLNHFDSADFFINKVIKEELRTRKEAHHLHWFYLGVLQHEKDNFSAAIQSFDKCLLQYSQFSDAQFYKALCYAQQNRKKEAIEFLLLAKENLRKGYSINEDNAFYEAYPYQISKFMLDGTLEWFQQETQEQK